MENHRSWVNPRTKWQFSIAMLMSQQKAKRPNDGYFLWVSCEFVFLLDLWITKCSLGCTDSRILRGKLQGFNKAGLVQFPIGEIWKEPCNRPPKKSDLLTCLLMHLNAKRMWTVEIESSLERWQMAWIFSRPSRFFHMSWSLNYKRRGTSSSHSFWYLLRGAVG